MDSYYNYIFDDFMCRVGGEIRANSSNVIRWWPIDDVRIIVELSDGNYYKYDSILKDCKVSRRLHELLIFEIPNENSWRIKFSNSLYRYIIKSGYTQDMLSWEAKVSTGSISMYVNADRTPNIYILLRLARTTDCKLKDVITLLCINRECENNSINYLYLDDEDEWAFEFSHRLKRILRKNNYSQKMLAEILNISNASSCRYLNGQSIPSAYIMHKIIKIFDLSVNEIKELLLLE